MAESGDQHERSRAQQQRELLPRQPSDRVVGALIVVGLAGWAGTAALGAGWGGLWLVPGGLAATVQKVGGHWRAWRAEGVEHAFVVETSALSFYLGVAALAVVGVLESANVLPAIHAGWFVFAASLLDTTVRRAREGRYA